MKRYGRYLGAAIVLAIVVGFAALSFGGVLGLPSSSSDTAVLWRNNAVVEPFGDTAVLWRNGPVQLVDDVAVMWRNSIVADPPGDVAVLWRNNVVGDPVGGSAVMWRG